MYTYAIVGGIVCRNEIVDVYTGTESSKDTTVYGDLVKFGFVMQSEGQNM